MPPSDEDDAEPVAPPGSLVAGVRTGLEMCLVGLTVALLGLPAGTPLQRGLVAVGTVVAMTVVLFWSLNKHLERWSRRLSGRPEALGDPSMEDL